MSNGYNLQMRGDGRRKFNYNYQDVEIESLLGRDVREVRMGGDTLMAGIRPRISFKQKTRVALPRNLSFAAQNYIDNDDDLEMSVNNNRNEFSERQVILKGRGRLLLNGRLGAPPKDLRSKLIQTVLADAFWYKVTIPCGANFEKDFIIKKILQHIAPETFIPIMYQHFERSAIFYVDNNKIAKTLLNCDCKIFLRESFKLHVYVKPGHPNLLTKSSDISSTLKEKIVQIVALRYNQETNTLNLSEFHHDPALVDNHFCALFQPLLLTTVLDTAVQLVPNIQGLNLNGNKFTLIDRLSTLKDRFKNLKTLQLGDNLLKDINLIEPIRNLNLEELVLYGNPFYNSYIMRKSEYVSDVRNKFPKLLRLDGIELPPSISFDLVEEDLRIPPSKKVFSVNSEVNRIASQFIQQYFSVFDNENRQTLMHAYHESAVFSMTVSPSVGARPNSYLGESRNILRLNDQNRLNRMLKRGKLAVVSAISEFPKTKHNTETFTMDVSFCSESMMLVTVAGLFKESNDLDSPFRYFNRTLIIVPEGDGFVIINEQLYISNATQLQQKLAMKQTRSTEVTMSYQEPVTNCQNKMGLLSEDVKEKMVKDLSQETNMNIVWSHKCLTEVEWNYEQAISAFQQFFTQGIIPAEAFNKST
ncbi:nuclear RNA export factor 1-like isoform X2 [Leptopilina boulardi]|uniref:nuclear RNA export factor 1-like isoform X2 n=1 Tax=Leptopilina boulardi TaxID=63433 RepID=UPI0021F6538A|nr:nuclear RNA export factor 1-like isoform X2 [Leptopilina boulardi]